MCVILYSSTITPRTLRTSNDLLFEVLFMDSVVTDYYLETI